MTRLHTANNRARRLERWRRTKFDARVAALEAEVKRLSTVGPGGWPWQPAWLDELTLADGDVLGSDDTTYEPMGGATTRTARLTVRMSNELSHAVMERGRLNWRGIGWHAHPSHLEDGRRGILAHINLEATAPRGVRLSDLPAYRRGYA